MTWTRTIVGEPGSDQRVTDAPVAASLIHVDASLPSLAVRNIEPRPTTPGLPEWPSG